MPANLTLHAMEAHENKFKRPFGLIKCPFHMLMIKRAPVYGIGEERLILFV